MKRIIRCKQITWSRPALPDGSFSVLRADGVLFRLDSSGDSAIIMYGKNVQGHHGRQICDAVTILFMFSADWRRYCADQRETV